MSFVVFHGNVLTGVVGHECCRHQTNYYASSNIVQYEHRGIAKFGCKLATLRLKHIRDDDPGSFRGE